MYIRVYTYPMKQSSTTKIQQWGNSLGLRIPKEYTDSLGVQDKTQVEITLKKDSLTITPIDPRLPRTYSLDELLTDLNPDTPQSEPVSWGSPVGKELW